MDLLTNLGVRFLINVIAVSILTLGIYYQRHERRDSLTLILTFNLFLFPFLTLNLEIGSPFAFTLFAILAVTQLRSETIPRVDFAYLLGAIALAVINAAGGEGWGFLLVSNLIILLSAYLADHRTLIKDKKRHKKNKIRFLINDIDPGLMADKPGLKRELATRYNLAVLELRVRGVDESTRQMEVDVTYLEQN